jgi:hypothetical protein
MWLTHFWVWHFLSGWGMVEKDRKCEVGCSYREGFHNEDKILIFLFCQTHSCNDPLRCGCTCNHISISVLCRPSGSVDLVGYSADVVWTHFSDVSAGYVMPGRGQCESKARTHGYFSWHTIRSCWKAALRSCSIWVHWYCPSGTFSANGFAYTWSDMTEKLVVLALR